MKKFALIFVIFLLCGLGYAQFSGSLNPTPKKSKVTAVNNNRKASAIVVTSNSPWTESFSGSEIPTDWSQETVTGTNQWEVANGVASFPDVNNTVTKLVTPQLDLSSINSPTLTFDYTLTESFGATPTNSLKVYYKLSSAGEWTLLKEIAAGTGFGVTTGSAEIALLDASEDYYLAIEAVRVSGFDIQIDNVSVDAGEAPFAGKHVVTPSTPWIEDFNSAIMPAGWSEAQILGSASWTATEWVGQSGSYGAAILGTGNVNKLISPQLDLTDGSNPILNFWYNFTLPMGGGDIDTLRVYYKTSAAGEWTFIKEFSRTTAGMGGLWEEANIELPNPTDDYYIAFEGMVKTTNRIIIDDIEVSISEAAASAIVVTPSTPWTEDFNAEASIPAGWTQDQVSGEVLWNAQLGSNDGNSAYAQSAAGNVVKLITPALDLTDGSNPVLTFSYNLDPNFMGGDFKDELKVYYRASASGAWTLLETYTNTAGGMSGAWVPDVELDLPEASDDYYLAFEALSLASGKFIWLDDIEVSISEETPEPITCETPDNVSHSQTNTETKITWNQTEAGKYHVYVLNEQDESVFKTTITDTFATISHDLLESEATYTYHVSSVCSSTLSSDTVDGQFTAPKVTFDFSVQFTFLDGGGMYPPLTDGGNYQNLSSSETVYLEVLNNSPQIATDIPITIILNDDEKVIYDTIKTDVNPQGKTDNRTYTFDLSAYKTHKLVAIIEDARDADAGNDTAIVNFSNNYSDLGITRLVNPVSGIGNNAKAPVQIEVKNFGTYDTIRSFRFGIRLNGTSVNLPGYTSLQYVQNCVIAPNDSAVFTLDTTLNMSAYESYQITAYLYNTYNKANDTIHATVVLTEPVEDAGVADILEPVSGADLGSEVTVKIAVKNFGNMEISDVPVNLWLDGTVVATETVESTIAPDSTFVYTFDHTLDLSESGNHTIVAFTTLDNDADETNDTAEAIITISAGLATFANAVTVSIYPNPVSDMLYIQSEYTVKRIEIFDMQGKLVKTILNDIEKISVNDLKSGVYVLKLTTDNGEAVQRFVRK